MTGLFQVRFEMAGVWELADISDFVKFPRFLRRIECHPSF
jgi:hypothetical protein